MATRVGLGVRRELLARLLEPGSRAAVRDAVAAALGAIAARPQHRRPGRSSASFPGKAFAFLPHLIEYC